MAGAKTPRDWIELQRRFAAPWQVIIRQWLEPHLVAAWFGPLGYAVTAYRLRPVEGGEWWLTMRAPDGAESTVSGHYIEIDPPYRLRLSWSPGRSSEATDVTEVELMLEPRSGGTLLRLRHGPFADAELREANRIAWSSTLDSLALQLVEDPG
jgi:uncharacterized protein YndB with AHSA1/START domain